ncbi:DUF7537 family lipoprotein [Halorarius litoreus]|uniref:DUF7537 family lipoprotein n=1 Tax=Halorarius litoreus TaxID=2962676 RepID=UPI0020CF0326|nr:hypothetical protein [Halorarius litoreus]
MFARTLPALAVALLLVLAGCSGAGGPGAADTATPVAPTGNDGATTGAAGGGDAALDLTDPESTLRSAESFTAAWRYSGTDADGVESTVAYTYRADLEASRAHIVVTSEQAGEPAGGSFERFIADGIAYTQVGSGDAVFYQAEPQADFDVLSESLARTTVYDTDTDSLEKVGTETYNGVRVDRYELSANASTIWTGMATVGSQPSDFDEFDVDYVVLVDADGLARYESWTFDGTTNDGQRVNGAWEYSLSGVGSTTVEAPDWLDDARAQTGN